MTIMSRAFVKEDDEGPPGGDVPERHISEHRNYVTPAGLTELEERAAACETQRSAVLNRAAEAGLGADDPTVAAEVAPLERDLRYYRARVESAVVVDPHSQPPDEVAFGARVTVRDEHGVVRSFTIVGEDEADLKKLKVSYVSPVAEALTGSRVGGEVVWQRPAGDLRLTITEITYPE
jgi:transcription elongation factor GreB